MITARQFALASAVCLAACGSDEAAKPETTAAVEAPQSASAVVAMQAAADSTVAASAGKTTAQSTVLAPSNVSAPSTSAAPSTATSKPAVTPASPTAAPVASTPVTQPVAKPAAPAPTVATVPAPTPAPAVATAPTVAHADPALGAPLYDANCKKCHGAHGVAVKVMQSKFPKMLPFDAAFFAKTTDEAIVAILTNGKGTDMKSFKDKLSHAEMASVAAYIRTFAP